MATALNQLGKRTQTLKGENYHGKKSNEKKEEQKEIYYRSDVLLSRDSSLFPRFERGSRFYKLKCQLGQLVGR